jgi:hypothetical protein
VARLDGLLHVIRRVEAGGVLADLAGLRHFRGFVWL